MASIIGNISRTASLLLPGRLEDRIRDPVRAQARTLRSLVRRASGTEWGLRYGFEALAADPEIVYSYQSRMPLNDYETFRLDVERTLRGEANILWPGAVKNFAVSSGTVSAGKLIPMSPSMVSAQRRVTIAAALHYVAGSHRWSVLGGKLLSLPGRAEPHPDHPDVLVGEMSGILALSAPATVNRIWQAASIETLFLENWEAKLDAVVRATIDQDVRALAMVPTWAVVLFDRLFAAYRKRHGSIPATVRDVWPNLRVFFSGGVSLESYRSLLEARIGQPGTVDFLEFYGASEGIFGTQIRPEESDMLLSLDSDVFYEFVPVHELGQQNPRRRTVADVETGVRYAMFVTTCSGFWSYGMRDVIRFTSLFPHRIVVAGRTPEMLDKFGEALFVEEARSALEYACRETGSHLVEFHVAPRAHEEGACPALEWLLEFDGEPNDLAAFARLVDEHIQAINRHYQIRREARALEGPDLHLLPRGTFYGWLEEARPSVGAQTKVLRMSADRMIADGLSAVASSRQGERRRHRTGP